MSIRGAPAKDNFFGDNSKSVGRSSVTDDLEELIGKL